MTFNATKTRVSNRGVPPDDALATIVNVVRGLPIDIFAPRPDPAAPNIDIYTKTRASLGPRTEDPLQWKAWMCEVLRVLGGFESSWKWNEGADTTNPEEDRPETMSAGFTQISHDSLAFGQDLRDLCAKLGIHTAVEFRQQMMANHAFAIEYTARLLRHTDRHNGPVHRHEIDQFLSRAAMVEFQGLLA